MNKKSKMKIAFIVGRFPKLSETFILNQITGLLDLGNDVEIFASSNPDEEEVHSDILEYKLMEKVHYFEMPNNMAKRFLKAIYLIITNFHKNPLEILGSLNFFKYGKYALSLRLLFTYISFLDKDFDIIQCHFGPNGNIGAYLKQIGIKGKLVTMFHGCDIRLGKNKGGKFYNQLFEFGDCFLAISDYNYKNLIRFGLDPQKIIYHSVGIDINKFPYRWQSNVVGYHVTIIILTVARLVEEKGYQYGIQAISKLLKNHPELKLEYHIVGDGPLDEHLRKQVKELNLDKIVQFHGPMEQEDVIKIMQKAHIFLLPSIAEALPVVLMEAQAVGLPIIATNVGSVSQMIINGESGFLVPDRDVNALEDKLYTLISHPEMWLDMGKSGRKIVEEKYNVIELNLRLLEIYQNLIQKEDKIQGRSN